MANKERTETILSKRLRTALSQRRMDERELADAAGLSAVAIRKMLNGKTRAVRETNLVRIAAALGQSAEYFQSEDNAHITTISHSREYDLESSFGPSVRSALRLGDKRTLWLNYDTAAAEKYDPETLVAKITEREPDLPPAFKKYRMNVEAHNEKLKANPKLGTPYFDGPTFCLSSYHIVHSEDGHETKSIEVEFAKSRYANNVTAKSSFAANLRKKALKNFHFLDQPIEWLASGVGVAVVVFCDNGTKFIVARRSDSEKFRSREWDVSVVEGINPVKDRREPEARSIYIADVVMRAVKAELGIDVKFSDVKLIGFGVDLEYYQWNFIAYVDVKENFREVEDLWQTADERHETMEIDYVDVEPLSAGKFIKENPVWSCGMAALYLSLLKRNEGNAEWRREFHKPFLAAELSDSQ